MSEYEFQKTHSLKAGSEEFAAAVTVAKAFLRACDELPKDSDPLALAGGLYLFLATLAPLWASTGNEEPWLDSIAHGAKMILRDAAALQRKPKH